MESERARLHCHIAVEYYGRKSSFSQIFRYRVLPD